MDSKTISKSFSEDLSALIAASFVAFESNVSESTDADGMSFHQCLRTVMGTNPDWSFLAYRNSRALFQFSEAVYGCMTSHLGSNSEHWMLRRERNTDEVLDIVRAVGKTLDRLIPPHPLLRPGMKHVQGQGKPRAAIAVEAAVVAHLREAQYGSVLGLALSSSSSDVEMIEWLEECAGVDCDETHVDWALAKSFSLTAGMWFRSAKETTVRAFCQALSLDFERVSNDRFESRLEEIRRLAHARIRSVGL